MDEEDTKPTGPSGPGHVFRMPLSLSFFPAAPAASSACHVHVYVPAVRGVRELRVSAPAHGRTQKRWQRRWQLRSHAPAQKEGGAGTHGPMAARRDEGAVGHVAIGDRLPADAYPQHGSRGGQAKASSDLFSRCLFPFHFFSKKKRRKTLSPRIFCDEFLVFDLDAYFVINLI